MQTGMRRVPITGEGGINKTWTEMLPHYEEEVVNLKHNIAMLKDKASGKIEDKVEEIKPLIPAKVTVLNGLKSSTLKEGSVLFTNRPNCKVDQLAPELQGLQAFSFEG